MLSSKARRETNGEEESNSCFLGFKEYEKNPYDDVQNPSGIIQMGLAQNQLSFDLLESWLTKNLDVATFVKNNGGSLFRELALFQDYHGLPAFKKVLADFMGKIRMSKVSFDPNRLVLTAGATSAHETLMFCLANPGEAFLIPIPYFPVFDSILKWRTGVELVPIHCSSLNKFKITESALQEAYRQAQNLNLTVKGVLITNPTNPLGRTMSLEELNHLINFAMAKNIHIISDEIYLGTVFDSQSFISIIEVARGKKLENTDILSRIHIVYGLSKDLGLPGFRVGVIHSDNETVISAATKMSSFGLVSSQTQYILSNMLADKKFMKMYMKNNRRRLKKRQEMLASGLKDIGIRCLKSNAGLFCWVDMRHLLSSNTFEAEMELWKRILTEAGLNITTGRCCHCNEPGWFRICFANMKAETLKISMQRMKVFVDAINGQHAGNGKDSLCPSRRKSLAKRVLFQVSLCDHENDC